jgi:hypothetical protein
MRLAPCKNPIREELYRKVAEGDETRRVLESNTQRLSPAARKGTEGSRRERNVGGGNRGPLTAPRTRRQVEGLREIPNVFSFAQMSSQISLARLPFCHCARLCP